MSDEQKARMRRAAREKLRALSRHFQALESHFSAVLRGEATLEGGADGVKEVVDRINAELAALEGELAKPSVKKALREGPSEAIVRLRDQWAFLKHSPVLAGGKAQRDLAPDTLLRELNQAVAECHVAVAVITHVTIPPRLNEWLKEAPPGYHLSFHALFEDEIRRKEDRQALLDTLALAPKQVPYGLVSPAAGLVYRHSGKRWWVRWLSIAGLAFAAYLVGAALFFGEIWPGWILMVPNSWRLRLPSPDGDSTSYFLAWVSILLGIVVHAIVDVHKRGQEGSLPLFALGLVPKWIEARIGLLLQKGLLSLVALFGLFSFPVGAATAPTAFLVGYSLDSFVGLFGEGFEGRAKATAAGWKERVVGVGKGG